MSNTGCAIHCLSLQVVTNLQNQQYSTNLEDKQISHPSFSCKRSGLFLMCLLDQVLKNTTKKGFLHRQSSLLLFSSSNYFLCQTWKSPAAVSDHVEKCLHCYSYLCCLAKESKLAQVQLPSAQCWIMCTCGSWCKVCEMGSMSEQHSSLSPCLLLPPSLLSIADPFFILVETAWGAGVFLPKSNGDQGSQGPLLPLPNAILLAHYRMESWIWGCAAHPCQLLSVSAGLHLPL